MPDPVPPDIVLGVDPGLGTTGWGVVRVNAGKCAYLNSGKIHTKADQPIGRRLDKLFAELQRVTVEYHVTRCAVESGFVGRSPLSALKLGEARAAAILAAETLQIPVTCIAPREVKMAVVGRGGAAKEQVSYMVGRMLGIEFEPGEDDISDALAVALCLVLHERPLAVPQRER